MQKCPVGKVCVLLLVLVASIATLADAEWEQIPFGLTHVSASLNHLWGVNNANQIFICDRPCSSWRLVDGSLKQLDVDDHEVWGVNSADHIWKRPVDGSGSWQSVAGRLKHVSASGHGYIWGVNNDDAIYKCKKPCSGTWVRVDGALKQIDGGQRNVYGVNSANHIYTRPVDGSGAWRRIPGSLKYVTASGTGDVFGVSSSDSIYRCKKPCVGEFELMGGLLNQCDATVNGLFGVNDDRNIFHHSIPM